MQHETVTQMFKRYHADKKNGVKRGPLHTLQECCEEAGITPGWFGRYAAQYPNPPQPVINSAKNVGRGAVKYYRKHEFLQWVNQVRQQQSQPKQQEKTMPDLKSELSKVINSWEAPTVIPAPAPKAHFSVTNNVCRTTFECIQKNPGKTRKEVIDVLNESGYKPSSTTTLIGQMIKQNHVRESNGLLYAVNTEYKSLKSAKAWAKLQAKEQAPQRKVVTITNTRTGEVFNPRPAPAPAPAPVEKEWEPNDVIAKLNVHQALALFKALRNILVG